jgi:hypothetical protein
LGVETAGGEKVSNMQSSERKNKKNQFFRFGGIKLLPLELKYSASKIQIQYLFRYGIHSHFHNTVIPHSSCLTVHLYLIFYIFLSPPPLIRYFIVH